MAGSDGRSSSNNQCPNGVDLDRDGYGEGCARGDDCDDNNKNLNVDCCANGISRGCQCTPDSDGSMECYDGDQSLLGVGLCRRGSRTCLPNGVWSGCVGQELPSIEVCDNGDDNDCDGAVDEEVLSACGNCIPGCDGVSVGAEPFLLPADNDNITAEGVALNPDGDLILNETSSGSTFLWVANDGEGTVSKIDTRTGIEVARYPSVVRDVRLVVPINEAVTGGNTPFATVAGTSFDPARVKPWDARGIQRGHWRSRGLRKPALSHGRGWKSGCMGR